MLFGKKDFANQAHVKSLVKLNGFLFFTCYAYREYAGQGVTGHGKLSEEPLLNISGSSGMDCIYRLI